MSLKIKIFQSLETCSDLSALLKNTEFYDGLPKLLENSVKSIESVKTFEDVMVCCAEFCGIPPRYFSLFGLFNRNKDAWVNPSCSVDNGEDYELEFRVRFIFHNEHSQRQTNQPFRFALPSHTKHNVMNGKVLAYLYYQKRSDFQEGYIHISGDTLDVHSANLGIAVMDMICIACALKKRDLCSLNLSLKKLVSKSYAKKLRVKNFLKRKIVNLRFRNYLRHFEATYDRISAAGFGLNYYHTKYLENLDAVTNCLCFESFECSPTSDFSKVSISNTGEVTCYNEKSKTEVCCNVTDVIDLRMHHENEGNNCWSVTLTQSNGDALRFQFASKMKAERMTGCLNGYYNLLVDAHHFLCKEVSRPSLKDQLILPCHGPITQSYAEYILKHLPNARVSDCILRCSPEKYHEYFINTIVSITPEQVDVMNFKISHENGELGIFGDSEARKYNSLSELIDDSVDNFKSGRVPFNVLRLLAPSACQPNSLLIHLKDDCEKPPDCAQTQQIQIISRADYKLQKLLGFGKYTEVTLFSLKHGATAINGNKKVVVKKVYRQDDLGQMQHISASFQESMLKLNGLYNMHLVMLLGSMSNSHVLEYVPYGSITKYAEKHKAEVPSENWLLSVIWQLTQACAYIEKVRCAHGNISGKNVLLHNAGEHPYVKLADPGIRTCRKVIREQVMFVVEPTLQAPWLAIEFCNVLGMPASATPTIHGDKWSYASTVCEICQWGLKVEPLGSAHEFYDALAEQYFTASFMEIPAMLQSPDKKNLLSLLKQCWNQCPQRRPSFVHILQELSSLLKQDIHFDDTPFTGDDLTEFDVYEDECLLCMKNLGSGHFGYVDLCEYTSGRENAGGEVRKEEVAVKSLKMTSNTKQSRADMFNEIETMKRVNHRYVVKLKGITEPSNRIVMEYLPCGSLQNYLHTEKNKKEMPLVQWFHLLYQFASQIAEGMLVLNEHRLIHRDLATRNILLDRDSPGSPMHIKISDFGLSRVLSEDKDYYSRSGPEDIPCLWYAPECLQHQGNFRFESDIWSYGVTVWEMFSYGDKPRYPVHGPLSQTLFPSLKNGTRLAKPHDCPDPVYKLMLNCWKFNPRERIPFNSLMKEFGDMAAAINTLNYS